MTDLSYIVNFIKGHFDIKLRPPRLTKYYTVTQTVQWTVEPKQWNKANSLATSGSITYAQIRGFNK